ncbi:MAG: MBL fold metallo-hydrolase, partial [Bacteroidia bacterium]|nr:MBL fold metallo-hydrolase [Bacteroidia bacterium]
MDVSIKFLGAAQSVTGSKYLLTINSKKILIDCGLFQGQKELRLRNWDKLHVDPVEIDVVVITHAHIDHVGYLPRLVKDGFRGKVICTNATESAPPPCAVCALSFRTFHPIGSFPSLPPLRCFCSGRGL